MDVSSIRNTAKDYRNSLLDEDYDELSSKVRDNLTSILIKHSDIRRVLCYYPLEKEVRLLPLYEDMLEKGYELYFPITYTSDIKFYRVFSLKNFKEGKFRVFEPVDTSYPLDETTQNGICIIPGLAFSKDFHRIGYGAGYYDRFLKDKNLIKIGTCFEGQFFEIEPEEHDVDMDYIVTNDHIYSK